MIMKRLFLIGTVLLALVAAVYSGPKNSAGQFEQLKSLAGEWHGTDPKGQDIAVSYEVVSNGSAVMERIRGDEPDMVTIYHLDGDKLMMTHYCSAMNQPRMRVTKVDAGAFTFEAFDITNLAKEEAGHMIKLVLTMKDADHISHAWTFSEAGKEMTVPFELQRVKMSQK